MLGLDGVGKTTILYKLKNYDIIEPLPTQGFNIETLEYKNNTFEISDLGGKGRILQYWFKFLLNA